MLWPNFNTGLKLIFLFFFGMFIMIMSLKQWEIKSEPRTKLNHNTYTLSDLGDSSNLIGSLSRTLTLYLPANSGLRSTYLPRLQRKIVQFEMNHIFNSGYSYTAMACFTKVILNLMFEIN